MNAGTPSNGPFLTLLSTRAEKSNLHCRSTALYSSSPRNRSTSSSVCMAGALVPSPPCLGEGPHGWVPVDTHSTPVLTSVRRLWVANVLYEPDEPQEHAQPAHSQRKIDSCTLGTSRRFSHVSESEKQHQNIQKKKCKTEKTEK